MRGTPGTFRSVRCRPVSKIEDLTAAQEAAIPAYYQKQRSIIYSTEPVDPFRAATVLAIYEALGRQAPQGVHLSFLSLKVGG